MATKILCTRGAVQKINTEKYHITEFFKNYKIVSDIVNIK